jgi:hypothetical protein
MFCVDCIVSSEMEVGRLRTNARASTISISQSTGAIVTGMISNGESNTSMLGRSVILLARGGTQQLDIKHILCLSATSCRLSVPDLARIKLAMERLSGTRSCQPCRRLCSSVRKAVMQRDWTCSDVPMERVPAVTNRGRASLDQQPSTPIPAGASDIFSLC